MSLDRERHLTKGSICTFYKCHCHKRQEEALELFQVEYVVWPHGKLQSVDQESKTQA